MISTTGKKQLNNKKLEIIERKILPVNSYEFPKLRERLLTSVDQAKSVLVNYDRISGETENDRNQIFSDMLSSAAYFGINIDKLDFHKPA